MLTAGTATTARDEPNSSRRSSRSSDCSYPAPHVRPHVAINLKKLAGLEGKGRTIRDLVRTYIDRYNLAPKQQAVTVHQVTGNGHLLSASWALIPSWRRTKVVPRSSSTPGLNHSGEPSFRSAFKRGRLLIPVSGFYEWAVIAGRKRPSSSTQSMVATGSSLGWVRPGQARRPGGVLHCDHH